MQFPQFSSARIADTLQTWLRYIRYRTVAALGIGRRAASSGDVAIIALVFPPGHTGGVFRPMSWTVHFSRAGQPSSVFCLPAGEMPTTAGRALQEQIPRSVPVNRPLTVERNPFFKIIPSLDGGILSCLDIVEHAIACYKENRPSVILASGPPFAAFVAGHLLSKYWRIPLVLDYRDEWSQCPFPFVQSGWFDRIWERRVNQDADAIVCVSQSQMNHHLAVFPSPNPEKFHVIPNGWEPEDNEELYYEDVRASEAIRIGFAGYLGDHTIPAHFLHVLGDAIRVQGLRRKVQVHFMGSQSPKAAAALSEFPIAGIIHTHGLKPKGEALRFMREMDILLILNNRDMSRYIPGKLYDYLTSGTPILSYGRGGEIERVLQATEGGLVIDEGNVEALATAIDRLATRTHASSTVRQKWLAAHTRAQAAARMLELIKSTTKE